jgi:hypothetical protein
MLYNLAEHRLLEMEHGYDNSTLYKNHHRIQMFVLCQLILLSRAATDRYG